jgi:hypothetical protein
MTSISEHRRRARRIEEKMNREDVVPDQAVPAVTVNVAPSSLSHHFNVRIRPLPTGYKMNAWCKNAILVAASDNPISESLAALRVQNPVGTIRADFFWDGDGEIFESKVMQ